MSVCQDARKDDAFQKLAESYDEYLALSPEEQDEYALENLDDIDAILHDAGFYAITDADQGIWTVYAPIPDVVTEVAR